MKKYGLLAEALAVFAAIEWYVWELRFTHPQAAYGIALALVASWALHKNSLRHLGIWPLRLSGWRIVTAFAIVNTLIVLSLGIIAGDVLRALSAELPARILMYLPWALLQQIVANGYFALRLSEAFGRRLPAAALTGILFAAVHAPNPALVLMGLANGAVSAAIFLKYRSVWPLAIAHALIAAIILVCLPESWHHHLRIGPGY